MTRSRDGDGVRRSARDQASSGDEGTGDGRRDDEPRSARGTTQKDQEMADRDRIGWEHRDERQHHQTRTQEEGECQQNCTTQREGLL